MEGHRVTHSFTWMSQKRKLEGKEKFTIPVPPASVCFRIKVNQEAHERSSFC